MAYAALACRVLTGLVFVVSAFSKVRSVTAYREFASWLAGLPVPLASHRALAPILAMAEAAIVVLVAVPPTAAAGQVLAALTLAVLTAGTAVAVRHGARASCRCFGPSPSPLAWRHVLRNAILLVAAVAGGLGAGRPATRPAEIVLCLMAAAAAATFAVFLDDLAAVTGRGPAPAAGNKGLAGLS